MMKTLSAKFIKLLTTIIFFVIISGCGGYITDGVIEEEEDFSDRVYEYYVPASYDSADPIPIVFVFHGAQSSSYSMRFATNFNDYAEEQNFIVVYPVGINGFWNINDACSDSYGDTQNDIGFVDYLLEEFSSDYNIDLNRVYACGFSMGAMFTFSLGLERSETFAAIASVAGKMTIDCASKFSNARRLPVMILHGMLDDKVSWESGGEDECANFSVPNLVSSWAQHNGCNQNPTIVDLPDTGEDYIHVIRESYDNCSDNTETILYKIEGGIHEWFTFEEFSASETILEFFFRHSN